MLDDPRLLVVDDEEVICQGCRRILTGHGFQVETSNDSCAGLDLAAEHNFAAILLDINMPKMNGIQFLQRLRGSKPDVPVIVITGYPSIPDAASAMRLGAADYVTKPFSPSEITAAVERALAQRDASGDPAMPGVEPWAPRTNEFRFWNESWFQRGRDGSLRVGAILTRLQGSAAADEIRLPAVGDTVYQGVSMAELRACGQSLCMIPAPVSGVVVEVNSALRDNPMTLHRDPMGCGWIARLLATHSEEDVENCRPRCVLLANANTASARDQSARLTSLGCSVHVVSDWEELSPSLHESDCDVLVLDDASLGENGPKLVEQINEAAPSIKIIVIASSTFQREAAYREQKIFYYSVEPFADNEIVEILDTVFRSPRRASPRTDQRKPATESVGSIFITNRKGKKVCLLADSGLLYEDHGLGWQLTSRLPDQPYGTRTSLGAGEITPAKIQAAARMCDRLLVLQTRDTGRPAGSLTRDTEETIDPLAGEPAGKITVLVVQPDSAGDGLDGLDDRTTTALAEHIVMEMASC